MQRTSHCSPSNSARTLRFSDWVGCTIGLLILGLGTVGWAQPAQPAQPAQTTVDPPAVEAPEVKGARVDEGATIPPPEQPAEGEKQRPSDPPGLKRLTPEFDVWIDPVRKLVVVQGQVCLRQGALEMFACPKGTKEHESIVSLNCKAWHVHAALIAVGAKPLHPVKFDPEYVPAAGTEIQIDVLWRDADGKNRKMPAQQWIKDSKGNPLKYPWVFGGSRFFKDEMTGQELYLAEDGDLICVSNFTTATLDLPIESTADAGGQLFLAHTDNIPRAETAVRLVLTPKLKPANKKDGAKPDAKSDAKSESEESDAK